MLQIKIFQVNPLGANCVVLWEDGATPAAGDGSLPCAVVDPGLFRPDEEDRLFGFLLGHDLKPEAILLTHGHFDHTWSVAALAKRWGCPVYMSAADEVTARSGSALLERLRLGKEVEPFDYEAIVDGQILQVGGASWQVIATPGHSPGSVAYYCAESSVVLTGDTLFAGSIGRSDLEGGDYDTLMKSLLEKLLVLPGDTDVIPGHGRPSTIAREAATNPFLLPFNEPDTAWWNQEGIELDGKEEKRLL